MCVSGSSRLYICFCFGVVCWVGWGGRQVGEALHAWQAYMGGASLGGASPFCIRDWWQASKTMALEDHWGNVPYGSPRLSLKIMKVIHMFDLAELVLVIVFIQRWARHVDSEIQGRGCPGWPPRRRWGFVKFMGWFRVWGSA